MLDLQLVIGNKRYSSWSLRPWLLLRHLGASFAEIQLSLYRPDTKAQLQRYSKAAKVPVLIDGDLVVWDSLAICEYLAELFPEAGVWPADRAARAVARAVAAEMHSSFTALCSELPMNCSGPRAGVVPSAAAQADIERIVTIWQECRASYGGPWLFGAFSAADAMYAPVVIRFDTYQVPLPPMAAQYLSTVLADTPMREWIASGREELELVPEIEIGTLIA
ncbi:MAG TPA: glutathione S-transferase family protein [Terriglobales bacterium]|nr:glutathione S-transferase family protein [Terriglobales bacterium]